MQGYRTDFVRLLYAIILAQFIAIAILLGGFSNEYLTNVYFHAWVGNNYPWLSLILQGQFDAFLIGIALGATILLIQQVRSKEFTRSENQFLTSTLAATNQFPNGSTKAVSSPLQVEEAEDILIELEKQD